MRTILIVGGYGTVGRKIARQLAQRGDMAVIIAGRNLDKAQSAAKDLGVAARKIDIEDAATWGSALASVDLVVAAIDQSETGFVEHLGAQRIAYIDVTAGDAFFRKVEALDLPRPTLLSVGLAPGLTNLLAVNAASDIETLDSIDIGILMGTGDEHGAAAIAWSTAQMFDPEAPRNDKVLEFGPGFGRRKAYFMDFADQHVLNRTLGSAKAVTRVTYDSAFLTAALFWAGRRFAGNKTVEGIVRRISHMPTFGTDKCVLSVTATGRTNGQPILRSAHFYGQREASVTAAVAVATVEEMLAGRIKNGVQHIHQCIEPATIFAKLEKWGHGRFASPPLRSTVVP
ncbi:saccharopine dehydrogenase NADP-binding domain-containing protein [Devosia sp. XK-2]|uniref:saccharopine dehydrogenase NADP-binding domain-containing protein n=1 Tax=Devosia sp. XK-2 TaxID=3126689 RepID=UPI0030D62AC4